MGQEIRKTTVVVHKCQPDITCEETVQSQQHSPDVTCEETVQSQQHSPEVTCEETVQSQQQSPSSNILHQILFGPVLTNKEAEQPTLAGVHRLQICLRQLWNLDLSPKQYAYLKGAMLFNPAVQGLSTSSFIEGLQQEAERALREVIHLLHPEDSSCFSHILRAASTIQTVSHSLVTELFFKPVIGNTDMSNLLTKMLFVH